MKLKRYSLLLLATLLASCGATGNGFTQVDYEVESRDRYNNVFGEDRIPEQWENYGIGDPFLMRFNGEYYLYASTKDGQYGYKVWKSRDLLQYEYLGQYDFLNMDGTRTGQQGQYAPEVYYWNGDFYCYGSPAGKGHYVYKSVTGLPYGDFQAVTPNLGLAIDGSVFIDDDESMTFLTSGSSAIRAYEMRSMTDIKKSGQVELLSPLVTQTEGPFMMKHNDTYYLTYAGNHVKSTGYRIGYSYSEISPFDGFVYPANNSLALNTIGDFNGLGHSSTVLGPNLDSYYIAYHNLTSSSGPIRAFNLNRLFISNNRISMYGPKQNENLVPLAPTYVEYDSTNLKTEGNVKLSQIKTEDRYSVEYNFKNITNSSKLLFSDNGTHDNYIALDKDGIYLYINDELIASGTFNSDFDFTKYHSVRLNVENGHYRVFFDNLKKIEVTDAAILGSGNVGYENVTDIGTTTFSNDAFDSSNRTDPKSVEGEFFATDYLEESKLSSSNPVTRIEEDNEDYDAIYHGASSVKLEKPGDYLLYPIDAGKDALYGFELTYLQASAGAQLSLQIDNNTPYIFTLPKSNYSKNMNAYEDALQYVKRLVAEVEITKGLHTMKVELISGSTNIVYYNFFEDSKYLPDYTNDLSSYVTSGANYLSLWKLAETDGYKCHKAKAGVNNMVLFGDDTLTDYEVTVDIKVDVSAGTNAMVGVIVRCNNPTLYSGYVDQSAQGYFVGFNRLQLVAQKINYSSTVVGVETGDQYTLGEWHTLKVRVNENVVTVWFDNVEYLSYTDPYPWSHGAIALYSVNTESYYKNLSIKGIK